MNQQATPNITLFDLLARNWQRQAGIRTIRFNDDETLLAIVTEDGTIAFARMADNEPPESRITADGGQRGIRPRSGRPSPLIVTRVKGARSVCPAAAGGFLTANDKGELLRLSRAGETADTAPVGSAPATAFDRCRRSGMIAAVIGDRLFLRPDDTGAAASDVVLDGAVPALVGFSPDGRLLALAAREKVEIRSVEEPATMLFAAPLASDPLTMAWSPDSRWLAAGSEAGGLVLADVPAARHKRIAGFRSAVRSVDFSQPANALVASGAYRIAAWSLAIPPMEDAAMGALTAGRTGLAVVEAVAIQPQGDLVAAGYANGQVVVARLGSPDELILRAAGGPVTALAWTSDGRHLALGDALGNAAIVTFPPQLFK
jgi:hypothetical protein